MNREFLKNAGVPEDQINSIMAEYGKDIQAEKDKTAKAVSELDELKGQIETYKTQVTELEKTAGDNSEVRKQLDELRAKVEAEKKAAEEKAADEQLTATIRASFPADRKFVNEYTEQAMISQVKAEMNKAENRGKGIAEIFGTLTKDKPGIFANPNEVKDMSGFSNPDIRQMDEAKIRRIMGLPVKH